MGSFICGKGPFRIAALRIGPRSVIVALFALRLVRWG